MQDLLSHNLYTWTKHLNKNSKSKHIQRTQVTTSTCDKKLVSLANNNLLECDNLIRNTGLCARKTLFRIQIDSSSCLISYLINWIQFSEPRSYHLLCSWLADLTPRSKYSLIQVAIDRVDNKWFHFFFSKRALICQISLHHADMNDYKYFKYHPHFSL